jgi:tryptophan 2,3-dioxygenase
MTGTEAGGPMSTADELVYSSYLRLDDLLSCQSPRTRQHDELLFIIIHQVYELWFKQILHEGAELQARLEAGSGGPALAAARRIAKILKTVVGQLDVLETMTPQQFAGFRPELGNSSGFQSVQFRYVEAMLGRREFGKPADDPVLRGYLGRRPLFASLLRYLHGKGYPVRDQVLDRDAREQWQPDEAVQEMLLGVYAAADESAEICEAMIDIDEGVQEWRYRHVKMVERIIGAKAGTGGSAGSAYLRSTLFKPAFPDLWEIRTRL